MEPRAPGSLISPPASCLWALTDSRVGRRRCDRFAIRSYSPCATIGERSEFLQLRALGGQKQFSLARPLDYRASGGPRGKTARRGAITIAAAEQGLQHPRLVVGGRARA